MYNIFTGDNMKDKSFIILKDKNLVKSILILALPIMLSNVMKSIHDIVDMYFVANFTGASPESVDAMVASITVTNPIIAICQALAMGLMVAGAAIMSQYIGAGKVEKARKISAQLLIMCAIIGVLLNVVLYFATPGILTLMGATSKPLVFQYAKQYVMIRSFELTGLFIFFAFQASRQARGDTVSPVVLNTISIVLNIILTAVLVRKFELAGAAYATVIANMLIIPVCIYMMMRTEKLEMRLHWSDYKWNGKAAKKIIRLGWPASLSNAAAQLGFLIINSLVLGFPAHIISGIGVGGRINSILLFSVMSIGTALSTFVGQNVGAGNIERTRKCVKTAMIISIVMTVCGAAVMLWLREPIARIFIPDNPAAIDACVKYLFFLLIGLPLMGIFQIFIGTFQGAGRTDFSLILSSVRLWVLRIPVILIYMYVCHLEERSVWYAMIISNVGAGILGTFLYAFLDFKPRHSRMKKHLLKELEKEEESLGEQTYA